MDGTGDQHDKWDKPSSERQIWLVFSHMWNLDLKKWQRWHDCKRDTVFLGGGSQWEKGGGKKRMMSGEYDQSYVIHMF
jgi:hypothetical protein